MLGKRRRLNRFHYPKSRRGLIVPLDHGLTVGPLPGIESVAAIQQWIGHSAICGVILHKGMAERLSAAGLLEDLGLMIHLNGMSTLSARPDTKVALASVETALRLGADAVSFQVNFDGQNDAENLSLMGRLTDQAAGYELPVLAMVYDKVPAQGREYISRQRHLIRIAIELGCDAIKIAPPAERDMLEEILAGAADDIEIYVAGGAQTEEQGILDLAESSLAAGATGLCIGRNVFQRPNAFSLLDKLQELVAPAPFEVAELPISLGVGYVAH